VAELWTPEEFATFAKINTDQASKLRITGNGPPYIKLGRYVRYFPGDVAAWLKENKTTSTRAPKGTTTR